MSLVHSFHIPVIKNETLELLAPKPGGVYVDATLGGGSFAAAILERIGCNGLVIGIDKDPDAIEYSRSKLSQYDNAIRVIKGDFRNLRSILKSEGVAEIDGVVFDLGVSSWQLDQERRGFSFMRDEPLLMKMDPEENGPSAADIVNTYSESELEDLMRNYGEERYARRIARAIVERRNRAPISRTSELVDTIVSTVGGAYKRQQIHPATRVFLALRIATNKELDALEQALPAAIEVLKSGGRICVISFHSLEDRIVKSVFRRYSGKCICPRNLPSCQCEARLALKVLTPKPVVPTEEEVRINPRSRSARLRCAEKL